LPRPFGSLPIASVRRRPGPRPGVRGLSSDPLARAPASGPNELERRPCRGAGGLQWRSPAREPEVLFWKAYLPIENTLNGKRPRRLAHRPRAGPTPRGIKKITVQCRAWVLRRRIYRSAGSHRDYGPEALVRILLWAGFCLGLPELLSSLVWTLGP
jgi:hypothetical protein